MIWAYRLLIALNVPALLLSLYNAISLLPGLGSRYFTTFKAIMLVWPVLQLLGYWMAAKARSSGRIVLASGMLLGQFLVFTVFTIAFLTLAAIAMFPE